MAMNYLKTHPWITFQLDLTDAPVRFWTLLGDANAKCEFISGIPLMPEVAKRLNAVSLEKGARATTAIEGNTLSEEEVSLLARGKLDLPPSKEYLAQEVSIYESTEGGRRVSVSGKKVLLCFWDNGFVAKKPRKRSTQ